MLFHIAIISPLKSTIKSWPYSRPIFSLHLHPKALNRLIYFVLSFLISSAKKKGKELLTIRVQVFVSSNQPSAFTIKSKLFHLVICINWKIQNIPGFELQLVQANLWSLNAYARQDDFKRPLLLWGIRSKMLPFFTKQCWYRSFIFAASKSHRSVKFELLEIYLFKDLDRRDV